MITDILLDMKNDLVLKDILKRLSTEFDFSKVYLFGSRALKTHSADSDYDLLLIVNDSNLRPIQRKQLAAKVLFGIGKKVDVFIYTESEYNEWKSELSSVAYQVEKTGMELNWFNEAR